jgi:hypothetical protein
MIRVSNVKASRVLPKICSSAQGPSTEAFGTKGGELEHACWKNGIFTLYSCSSVGVVAVFFFTKSGCRFFHVHVNRPFMRPYPTPTTRIVAGRSTKEKTAQKRI